MVMESNPFIVSEAPASDRVAFFKRTYLHVAGAFAAFGALLYAFFQSGIALSIMKGFGSIMGSMGGFGILVVMLMFWGGTYVAQKMAENRASRPSQYLGLGLYVVLEAIIFVPLIVMVAIKTGGNPGEVLIPACAVTAALVVGLTVAVFTMGIDFSFLRVAIVIGSVCALAAFILFSAFVTLLFYVIRLFAGRRD